MNITKAIKKLCTPAYVYLVMSMISIIILMAQNAGNDTKFCIGSYTCKVMSTSFVFFCQALYTAIWTFILDSVCKKGYNNISWFLVLFPYLLFFIIIGLFILGDKKKEGMDTPTAGGTWQKNVSSSSSTSSASPSGGDDRCAGAKIVKKCGQGNARKEHCEGEDGSVKRCVKEGEVKIPCTWRPPLDIGGAGRCLPLGHCMEKGSAETKACSGNGKCEYDPADLVQKYDCNCKCGWYGEFCEQIGCRETQCGGKTKEEKKSNLAACKKLTAGREKAAAAAKK